MTKTDRAGPLSRFKVIDLTRVRAGPTCVRQLADWGADVIKVEEPPKPGDSLGGPRHGSDFQNLQRNKRSLTLNLKEAEGRAIFFKLVEQADVVVENYRPDVKTRLGIDYESLRKVNKRIVLGSISGYGQTGPYALRAGFDQIAQGMGGLMSVTGEPGKGPMRAGIAVADSSAGVYLSFGILAALLEREVSGEGQWVHTSLLQAMIAMCDFQAARWTMDRQVPPQAGNNHPTSIPTGVFTTTDGFINIAAAGGPIWDRVCDVLGKPEWKTDPDYATSGARSKNRVALNAEIDAITRTRPSAHWIEAINAAGVPCGPIYAMNEVFADPQVQAMGMEAKVAHPKLGDIGLINQPVVMSRTASALRTAAPDAGEHSADILGELGYDAAKIGDLKARGVI
jgi:crotonobetainyl-CoA:carnitine CoA-transferase CaiB-like acyl-CoA transferase